MHLRPFAVIAAASLAIVATLGIAPPARATTIALALDVVADGGGPFTPVDGPGADAGPANGIVRTHDHVTYRVSVNAVDGAADNETFRLVAPADSSWSGLPSECGAGSSVAGAILTCNLGHLESVTRAVSVSLTVAGTASNRQSMAVTGTVTADGAASPGTPVRSAATIVSAAPRYDLVKNASPSILRADVSGPGGESGMTLTYPITVVSRPAVPGQGRFGSEAIAGPIRFRDDVSGLEAREISRARLYDWAGPACGLNTSGVFDALPGGKGGGRTAVVDSGSVACSQAAVGDAIDVTLTGTDTSLGSVPDLSSSGGAIAGGAVDYVIAATITIWIPRSETAGSTWIATNTFTPLVASSVSGQSNYGDGFEPGANNVSSRTIADFLPGNAYKAYGRVTPTGTTVPGSGKTGDPYVTPDTLLRSQVSLGNSGLSAYRNAIACDTFDTTLQTLAVGPSGRYAESVGQTGARVEFAASSWTTPDASRSTTCDDSDGPWFADADAVPGGPEAVGKVRVVSDVPASGQLALFTYLRIDPGANGDRVRNFAHIRSGDTSAGDWMHDPTSADIAAGPLSDFLIRTADLARVTKKVVDPGTDPSTTPDETVTTTAGHTIRFAVYPTLTSADLTAENTTVTVSDILPAHATFVPGSASIQPSAIDDAGSLDDPRQRLTWTLPDHPVNEPIEPIDYVVDIALTTPPGAITNAVTVASPGDISPARFRTAERAIQVVSSGGIAVQKTAVDPIVVVGDRAAWDLAFVNTDASPASGVDLIDVLPFPGDGRSHFAGRVQLATPVDVDESAEESARYTAAGPERISLDTADPSNVAGGTTLWCSRAQFGTAACPAGLEAVTGVRITRAAPIPVAGEVVHRVTVTLPDGHDGDVLANRFGLRASNLSLPVRSDFAEVRLVAGEIGDRVWNDVNRDGLQGSREAGVGGVVVRLTGVDDRKEAVQETNRTASDGRYVFEDLRPGDYSVTFDAPGGTEWTTQGMGDDPARDSDVDVSGVASVTLAATRLDGLLLGIERDLTVDAGLVVDQEADVLLPPVDPSGQTRPPAGGGHDLAAGSRPAQGDTASARPAHLAFTGSDAWSTTCVGLGILVTGLVLLFVRRRRGSGRRRRNPARPGETSQITTD